MTTVLLQQPYCVLCSTITFPWEGKWFNQWPYYNTTVKLWLLCKNYVTFRKRSIVAVSPHYSCYSNARESPSSRGALELTSSCFLRLASASFLDSSVISSFMSRICRCIRLFWSFSRFSLPIRWSRSSVIFSRFSFSRVTRDWRTNMDRWKSQR